MFIIAFLSTEVISRLFIQTEFSTILLQVGQTETGLQKFVQWGIRVLNILVIGYGIYGGYQIFQKATHNDRDWGRQAIGLVGGLVIWFGIQAIIGDISSFF